MTNAWIIATDENVSALVDKARSLGGTVTAVTVGTVSVGGVDRLVQIPAPADLPVEALAPAVVGAVKATGTDVVFAANRPADRVLAGAVAAALNAPLLVGARSVRGGSADLSRFGGIVDQQVTFSSPVVAIFDGGAVAAGEAPAAEEAAADAYGALVTGSSDATTELVDLGLAKKIVAVGRGFKEQQDLAIAETLASAIGAEIACSRPVAEGSGWLPRDRYVGVSGLHLTPDLYVAVGISGQIQHTAGMKDAKTIVVINKDENAPFFNEADYGLVGDLYEVLPALTKAAGQ